MSELCFINGSPRREESCSTYLSKELLNLFNTPMESSEFFVKDILKDKSRFKEIITFDKIIFIFPLYVDSLPSPLLEFLVAFEEFLKTQEPLNLPVYALVNCGFIEGHQNKIALKILENFCEKVHLRWMFGVGIGGGEFMKASKSMPLQFFIKKPVYNSLLSLKEHIEYNLSTKGENIYTNAKISKRLFIFSGKNFWKQSAKKNNLKLKDLYRTV